MELWRNRCSNWTDGKWYLAGIQATDDAGNRETPGVTISFKYDTSTPVSTVTCLQIAQNC